MPAMPQPTRIDGAAPAVTRQERLVAAPPSRVFALLSDVSAWPAWQRKVTKAVSDGDLAVGRTFTWRSGVSITSTVTALEPGRAIAWTGRAVGTRAIHTWTLEEVEGGTLVRTEESMSGWLPALMTRTVQRTLETGVAATLDDLAEASLR